MIAALLARNPWPAPNLGGVTTGPTGCSAPNAAVVAPSSNLITSLIGKIDHNFNQRNMLSGRYFYGDSTQSFPLALSGGGILPGFNTFTPTRVQLVSISLVSVLASNMVKLIVCVPGHGITWCGMQN